MASASARSRASSFRLLVPAALPLGLAAAALACGEAGPRSGFSEADAGTVADGAASSSSSGGFGPAEAGSAPADGCSDDAKLVYVLSMEGDIYSFAPADKKFTKVGPLDCAQGGVPLVPIAMAVDRDAIAWVNMREDTLIPGPDTLYKFDTKTAACSASGVKGPLGGMGFSTNEASTDEETLFVVGQGSAQSKLGLNHVDFASESIVRGPDLKSTVDLELTGTGDGKLYAFLIDNPLELAEVDKTSGTLSGHVTLTGVRRPQSPMFAFSFWGGDFYFYTATDPSPSKTTTVARYRPSDGSIDPEYMTDIGFHIVGAGVSTCAPVVAPK